MPTLITLGSMSAKGFGFGSGGAQTYWVNKLDTLSSGWANNSYGGVFSSSNIVYSSAYNYNNSLISGMTFNAIGTNTTDWTTTTNSGSNPQGLVAANYSASSTYAFPVFGYVISAATNYFSRSTDGKNFTTYKVTPTGETNPNQISACAIDASSQFITFNSSDLSRWYYLKATGTTINWSVYSTTAQAYSPGVTLSSVVHVPLGQSTTTYSVGFNASTGAVSYQRSLAFTPSRSHRLYNSNSDGTNIWKLGWVENASAFRKTLVMKFDTSGNVVWAKRIAIFGASVDEESQTSPTTSCVDLQTGASYFTSCNDGLNFFVTGVNSSGTVINSLKITFTAGNGNDVLQNQLTVTADAVYLWITQFYATTKAAWLFKLPKSLALYGTYTGFTLAANTVAEDATLTATTATSSLTFTSDTTPVISIPASLTAGAITLTPVKTTL